MYDVCLVLEGTYPYVAGGVSTWVYELIRSMPALGFSIFYIGSRRPKVRRMHYPLPDNVVDFHEIYLFDYEFEKSPRSRLTSSQAQFIGDFVFEAEQGDVSKFPEVAALFSPDRGKDAVRVADLAYSREAWKVLVEQYRQHSHCPSMLDFFWTWRFIYLTFFSLLGVGLPRARVYHTVSTGYAGVVGALASLRFHRPLLLTEHGIYNRERRIEISQADWIYSESSHSAVLREGQTDTLRKWWADVFGFFGLLAYEYSTEILTLSEVNRAIQIDEGARAEKIRVIPNGVDCSGIEPIFRLGRRSRIALVGRVVPIKDIKTYVRAARIIADQIKGLDVLVVGPTDEDEVYFEECRDLVRNEGLEEIVRFVGKLDMRAIYPTIDVIVLTSHSEGQPLVILEAGMYGIPTVATNVGSCKELLEGASAADRLIGPSGIITSMCSPRATGDAVLRLLQDDNLREKMGFAARKRVETYYRKDRLIASYHQIYSKYIEAASWRV